MKKLLCLLVCLLLCAAALAEVPAIDYDSLTQEELQAVIDGATASMARFAPAVVAQKGDKNDTVKEIQHMLVRLKYLSGGADGDYGKKTVSAVEAYQTDKGLEVTGTVTQATYDALCADYAALPEEIECIEISAKNLNDEYQANEAAANKKYKGQLIEVSGKVGGITETWGTWTVSLDADSYGIYSVQCQFSGDAEDALAELSSGDRITIRGTCTGMSLIYVYLDECEIVG